MYIVHESFAFYLTTLILTEIEEVHRIEMRTRTEKGNSGIKQYCVPWLDSTLRLNMMLCIKPDDAEYKAFISNLNFSGEKMY